MDQPDLSHLTPWFSGTLYFLCLLLCLSLIVSLIATRPFRNPITRSYIIFGITVILWLFFSIIHQLPTHQTLKVLLFQLSTPLWLFLGTLALRFVETVTGTPTPWNKSPFVWISFAFSIIGVTTPWIEKSADIGSFGYRSVNGYLAIPAILIAVVLPFVWILIRIRLRLKKTDLEERGVLNTLFWATPVSMLIPAVSTILLPLLGVHDFLELSPIGFVFLLYSYYYAVLARKESTPSLFQAAGSLLDELKDGVVLVDLEGKVDLCNPTAAKLLGVSQEQMVGQQFQQLLTGYLDKTWYQDYPFRIERDNHSVSFNLSAILQKTRGIVQGKILILRDTTELMDLRQNHSTESADQKAEQPQTSYAQALALREAHERIRERESLLQALMDNLPFQVYVKDRRGIYILQNRLDQEVRGNLLGHTLDSTQFDAARILEGKIADQKVLSGENVETEYEVNVHGKISRFRNIKRPLFSNGQEIQGILGILMDITEVHRIEKERMEFKERLLQAHKMEAIGTLAGGIAHDFNNILGSLTGYAELAVEVLPKDTSAQNYLKEVLIAAERGRQLIQQILVFSRKDDKESTLVSLTFTLRETANLLRSTMPGNIMLKADIPADELFLQGDAIELHRIIMNLCTNAIHAMKENGGLLRIGIESVELKTATNFGNITVPQGKWNCLKVQDSGTGIPEHILPRIFDPFFTTKKTTEGTGLGLSVVLGIVQAWSGHIGVTSSPERGTEFRLYLPVPAKQARKVDQPTKNQAPSKVHALLLIRSEELTQKIRKIMADTPIQWSVLQSIEDMPRLWRIAPWKLAVFAQDELELPIAMLVRQWRSQGIGSSFIFLNASGQNHGNELDFLERVALVDTHESDAGIQEHMRRFLWHKSS